jgi:hypothetical protein
MVLRRAKRGSAVVEYREVPTHQSFLSIWGRNGFDGIESWWGGVPGSELPLNDRKT